MRPLFLPHAYACNRCVMWWFARCSTSTPKTSPVVWDVSGRLVGSHVEFAELCRRRYGLKLDVSEAKLADIVRSNADEAAQQQRRDAVR